MDEQAVATGTAESLRTVSASTRRSKSLHATTATSKALVYLRVSTARQATKNGEAEGYSIPAQREACLRRARELDAEVVDEFVDAGASARSADRDGLQRMLDRVRVGDIKYVIVHKLDRLARSRIDDAEIATVMHLAGTTLVSTSEQIDDSPSGTLLHGIMAAIAEHYSKNLSHEAKKGMAEKVRRGGTPNVAPLGYLNTTTRIDGIEVKTVEVDAERAPHVRWAFEQYATGDWSIAALTKALEERGFKSRTTRRMVGKPIVQSHLHRILSHPYYRGQILFNGVLYDGKHEPIVSDVIWQQVQDVLASRRINGDRSWRHSHYLKGSLRCGRCKGAMGYTIARGRGGDYEYFFCLAKNRSRTDCDLPYIAVDELERHILRKWAALQFSDTQIEHFAREAHAELSVASAAGLRLLKSQQQRIADLERRKAKLVDAYMNDAMTVQELKVRQSQIYAEIADAHRIASSAEASSSLAISRLEQVLALLRRAERVYTAAGEPDRQILNTAVFDAFYVDVTPDISLADSVNVDGLAPLSAPVAAVVRAPNNDETPAETRLDGGSILLQMAGLLTHSWNERLWRRVSELLEVGVPEAPHGDRRRQVKELRRPQRLSESQMDQVVDDYMGGMSSQAVGEKYSIDGQTVLNNLHARGVTPRPRTKVVMIDGRLPEAASLRDQGWSWVQLGKRYGCSRTTVRTRVIAWQATTSNQIATSLRDDQATDGGQETA